MNSMEEFIYQPLYYFIFYIYILLYLTDQEDASKAQSQGVTHD